MTALFARRSLGRGLERFSLKFSVLLEQNLNLALRVFQLLAAGGGKLHAFFKQRQRLFQGNLPFFQFLDNLFETLEAFFKLYQSNCSYTLL